MTDTKGLIERLRECVTELPEKSPAAVNYREAADALERLSAERDEANAALASHDGYVRFWKSIAKARERRANENGDLCDDVLSMLTSERERREKAEEERDELLHGEPPAAPVEWKAEANHWRERAEKAEAQLDEARRVVGALLACPVIADENHNDPEWGDPETDEAESAARAWLDKTPEVPPDSGGEAEPDAWQVRQYFSDLGKWGSWLTYDERPNWGNESSVEYRPLYATSPASAPAVTDEMVEVAADALCRAGGHDPTECKHGSGGTGSMSTSFECHVTWRDHFTPAARDVLTAALARKEVGE